MSCLKQATVIDPHEVVAREALLSERCICGAKKEPHQEGFCKRCLHSLPLTIRGELGVSMKGGYALAHRAALVWLGDHTTRLNAGRK